MAINGYQIHYEIKANDLGKDLDYFGGQEVLGSVTECKEVPIVQEFFRHVIILPSIPISVL